MSQTIKFFLLLCFDSSAVLKWSNFKCEDLINAKDFCHVEDCRLKAVRRNYAEMFFKLALYKVPITNVMIRLQLFQKSNSGGFQPFLYDINFNFCKLMKNSNYPMSFEKYVFDQVRPFSNMNTTCPLNMSHIIVNKFGITSEMVTLPLPTGVYRLQFTLSAYKLPRVLIQ
ncbi:uncharacterized protein LOC119614900 [Lucilia sericata]|uniref:uncharacterized protein LOC119614900 n=1 Tax=Lucilia sericata TaxID=13632 RepID=UPI0018A82125|nr:uncharacterized protein LOC119614900 [Lucilia sericata]